MSRSNEIFITGSTGIAGRFAVKELEQHGFSLKLLVRKTSAKLINHAFNYVQGDFKQTELLDSLSRNNNGIVHYACASLGGGADPQVDIDAMNILLKNWENGPFVYISSLDVYGFQHENKIIDETCPLSGEMNEYAAGKIACETLLIEESKRRGRDDFSIFRAPWIFAPNDKSKQHIVNRFIKKFDTKILLPGKSQEKHKDYGDCWIDARDLAWLVAESIKKPLGGPGNAIGGRFCWYDFFMQLKKIAHLKMPIVYARHEEVSEYAAELFGQYNYFCGAKVTQHFQFRPAYELNETLQSVFSSDRII